MSYNGTTVINSLDEASATTQVTVHKNWIGTPADSVTIQVLNGTEIVDEAELDGSEETPWTYTFTDLPKYEDGKEIQYTVEEDEVSGYTSSEPELKDGIWNITNTIEQDSVTVAVEKFWNEGTAATPNSVTFTLYADEQALGTITLDASTGWSTEISGLPRYAIPGVTEIYDQSVSLTTDGHAIRYTVEEAAVEGFTQTQVSRTETDGRILYQFTNQFDAGTVHFQVAKSWNDLGSSGSRPASIWVGLFADGTYLKNLELTADNNWVGEFSYLPQYSDVNVPITYTVREMTDENDTVGAASGDTIQLGENTYAVTIVDGQITNTIEGDSQGSTVTYSVDKVWNGPSSTNVSFGLYAGVNASDPVEVIPAENMTQNDETHTWSATFAPVPKFDSNGNRINYVVKEIFTYGGEEMAITSGIASIDGISYTVSSKQTGNNIILTNTVNETNDATYSVKKVWANIGEGVNPPDSVQVQLYADGVKVEGEEVTLNAENDWGYTWTNLQKYNSTTHMPIVYSVREVNAYEVTTLNEGEPLTHVIFIHGNDYYDVTYGEDGTITNTYNHSDIYSYRVDRVYNYYVDGTLDSTNTVTGTRVTGEKDETVTISDADKDSYKQTDGRSEYTFVSGGPVLEDGTTIGVTLDEANLEYVITLTYEYRYTTPDEPGGGGRGDRTVTVYYREEGTRDQLADTEQREYDYGDAWDVTDLTDLAIDGYVITRVEGDTSGDRLTSNKTVTVWYSNDETDIEDPDTPTTDLPDGGDTGDTGNTGGTGDTGNTGGGTDIGDEDVPLAEAPETGDASLLWVILAIASGSGLIWLALTGKKRKECEEQ